jgi:uncharacterized protein YeaO (DUF488 family)
MISRTHQSWPDGVAIELDKPARKATPATVARAKRAYREAYHHFYAVAQYSDKRQRFADELAALKGAALAEMEALNCGQ